MVHEKTPTEKRSTKYIPLEIHDMERKVASCIAAICRFRQHKHCRNKKSETNNCNLQKINRAIENGL